jgi:N-acetylglucosamine kinase-like BadF-type ATPase
VDAALVTAAGEVLGAARWSAGMLQGPADWGDGHEIGLGPAVEAVCAQAGLDPAQLPIAELGVYCLAGADFPEDYRRIQRSLAGRGWAPATVLQNDTFAVLRAGSDRGWGVAVVCGSGINCAGVGPGPRPRTVRFPAVGHVSGDWGGGYDVGAAALWHAVRAEDGRGDPTVLAERVPAHFGLGRPHQLTEAVYFGRLDGSRLAELSPVVFEAAREGDAVAGSIVDRLADEIVTMAVTAIRRLDLVGGAGLDVVLGGGIFRNDHTGFLRRIRRGIRRVAEAAVLQVMTDPPVVGAVLLGLDRLGAGPDAVAAVRAGLTHGRLAGEQSEPAGEPGG